MTTCRDVMPTFRYLDAPAAIDWLCRVFGFEERLVVRGDGDTIRHAQLTLGGVMIMLGSTREDELGRLVKSPRQTDGVLTQGVYVVVPEIDAYYERVRTADAEIFQPIEDQPHGGKLFTVRDPEGHLWAFGSYDPWA